MAELTQVLDQAKTGDAAATHRLYEAIYVELKSMALQQMLAERSDHTLQPTALVHETLLRLFGDGVPTFENRAHLFGAAARVLRRILIEHARRRGRLKRGGGLDLQPLDDDVPAPASDDRLLELDEALNKLAVLDPAKAQLVELRFFAGLSVDEVAVILKTSPSSVARKWRLVRAWLQAELQPVVAA